jgi:hypothetical protein
MVHGTCAHLESGVENGSDVMESCEKQCCECQVSAPSLEKKVSKMNISSLQKEKELNQDIEKLVFPKYTGAYVFHSLLRCALKV